MKNKDFRLIEVTPRIVRENCKVIYEPTQCDDYDKEIIVEFNNCPVIGIIFRFGKEYIKIRRYSYE